MMMSFPSFVLAILCSFFANGIYSQSLVQITGQFSDVKSEPVILGYYLGSKQYAKDTVQADAKGKFTFAYHELMEQGLYLLYFPNQDNKYVEFFVSDDQQFSVKGKLSDFAKTAVFSGSVDNTLLYAHLNKQETFRNKVEKWQAVKARHGVDGNIDSTKMADAAIQENSDAYKVYKEELFRKNPDSFLTKLMRFSERPALPELLTKAEQYYYYKSHFFDGIDWSFTGVLRSPNYEALLTEYMDNLTVQQPDSIIASCELLLQKTNVNDELFKFTLIELVNKYASSATVCFDAIYVYLVETYYLTGRATWMNGSDEESKANLKKMKENAARLKPVLCGSYAYNFNLPDEKGTKHELQKIAGERTILVFWASDCHKCEAFMKELATITDLCAQKGVAIVSVDNGTNPTLWKQKLEKYQVKNMLALTSPNSEELTVLIDQYDLYATPVAYFLDKDKKIVYKKLEVDQLKDIIERLPDVTK